MVFHAMKTNMNTHEPIFNDTLELGQNVSLVAIDLDGTLLRSDKTISDRTKSVISYVSMQGITVVIATGRSYEAMLPFKEELGLESPVICYNGAAVVDGKTGEIISALTLDDVQARVIIETARTHDIHMHGFLDGRLLYERTRAESKQYEDHTNLIGEVVNFDQIEHLRFLKAMYVADHDVLVGIADELRSKLGDDAGVVFSLPHFLEIMHADAHKGNALAQIAASLGIAPSRIIAFGDAENDISMLTYAHIGVAMENADDQVKQAVQYRAPSHDDDGVARFLEHYLAL